MTRSISLLSRTTTALALVLAVCAGRTVYAQEPDSEEKPNEPAAKADQRPGRQQRPLDSPPAITSDSRNVRIDVTVTQELGGEPVSKTLTFVVADSSMGLVRSGIDMPVSSGPAPVVNYREVGFNVDAGVRILNNNRIWLDGSLAFSSVLPPKSSSSDPKANYASFTNVESRLNLVLNPGKPVTLTQGSDPSTGQQYSVQVTATIIE